MEDTVEYKVLVPIANDSEEMEALSIIDVLRRAKATVTVASVEDTLEVSARRKVKIVADMLIDDVAKFQYDLIVLSGGISGAKKFSSTETLIGLLKKQKELNQPYGAICASPGWVLEPHGLLNVLSLTISAFYCKTL
ncbi:protein DJ-1 homolog B-like [Apium graveolens]|uniref:protein DJ-1 homolog B-like n=1 Tax=Apium graveolens TaxID=4045 RepID=UPI003D79004E